MSITSRAIVNQKLACARALLKLLNDQSTLSQMNQRAMNIALLQGAVFHLIYAYKFYLHEIAEDHQIVSPLTMENESQLLAALEFAGDVSSEALELSSLRQDPYSWLNEMHEAYAAIGRLPLKKDKDHAEAVYDHLIAAVSIDSENSDAKALTERQVLVWEKAFSALIFRQREIGTEY